MIDVRWEPWPEFVEDVKPLVATQYVEIALDQDEIALDPDWERYAAWDAAGVMVAVAARDGRKLVAWHVSMIGSHPHYRTTLCAMQDLYYVLPAYRDATLGLRLFDVMEEEIRKRGVKLMIGNTKLHFDRSALFERLGWRRTALTYSKVLK